MLLGLPVGLVAVEPVETEIQISRPHMTMTVLLHRPEGEGPFPLCLLLPGGPGLRENAELTGQVLATPLVERGWMVAVPVSPHGVEFFRSTRLDLLPELIGELRKRADIGDGRLLIGGVSNGGGAAILAAGRSAGTYDAVIAAPGFFDPRGQFVAEAGGVGRIMRGLKGQPVFLRTGSEDGLGWADRVHPVAVEGLRLAGAVVDARIVPGANHVFPLDAAEIGAFLDRVYRPR